MTGNNHLGRNIRVGQESTNSPLGVTMIHGPCETMMSFYSESVMKDVFDPTYVMRIALRDGMSIKMMNITVRFFRFRSSL